MTLSVVIKQHYLISLDGVSLGNWRTDCVLDQCDFKNIASQRVNTDNVIGCSPQLLSIIEVRSV